MLQAARRGAARTLQSTQRGKTQWQQVSSFASTSRAAQTSKAGETAEEASQQATPQELGGQGSSNSSGQQQPAKSARKAERIDPLNFSPDSFPSLLDEPHPILDSYHHVQNPATAENPFPSSVTFFNDTKLFEPTRPTSESLILSGGDAVGAEVDSAAYLATVTPLSVAEINGLHRHIIQVRRVVKMTGKGKNASLAALMVTGNGRGLVGYGDGKDINNGRAIKKAFHQAVKGMDYVERYDDRTIPAEVKGKWGGTTVTLRPRPAGFGLRCPPAIHAIARSCGISDLSASILGSTNRHNVVKATLQLLWGGSAPLGFGDGVGGSMRRGDRGTGMKTIRDIELARGRRLRPVVQ